MGGLREYLLSVVAGAFICGILSGLFPEGTTRKLLRLLCGGFLTIVVLHPLLGFNPDFLTDALRALESDGSAFCTQGEEMADQSLRELIKQETQAYILDKAAELNAQVQPEVILSPGSPPIPESVVLSGAVSPYAKRQLEDLMESELGIAKENQTWTG